jgi:tetratricopeptide (TPR) repeat protein
MVRDVRFGMAVRALSLAAALGVLVGGCGGGGASEPSRGGDAGGFREPTLKTDPLPDGAEAWSFLGGALFPPPLPPELRASREADLAEARATLLDDPSDPERWIWVGRREAYLGTYQAAIQTFTAGLERFPDDVRFLRHRGHRWITLREFGRALEDLTRGTQALDPALGAEIEPDGLPNPQGIALSTLAFNLWYHQALAAYLSGEFERARAGWEETLRVSGNPDLEVAARFWLYLTLRRLGADDEARTVAGAIPQDLPLLENGTYRDLLLVFRGDLTPDDVRPPAGDGLASATLLHGLGIFALLEGDEVEARRILNGLLERADQWAAFGYIAAEVELARRGW